MFMRISKTALVLLAAVGWGIAPAAADLQTGIEAYSAGDVTAATEAWAEGGDAGDATSAFLAAKMYEGNNGAPANPYKAVKYMTLAAEGNHVQAQVELGDYYRSGKPEADVKASVDEALRWYEKAALNQHAEAQMKIGEMHYNGEGAERNRFEGIRWYELAAEKYYTPALIFLSGIYWEGDPLPQDKAKAYSFLLLARQGATDDTRAGVDALMSQREKQMSRAQMDAGIRLAEAFRLEHTKK
ncbi:MAG: tetratricopeptide repeat protein [Alphaproteobacteria bacterium]|nr:tetratricopeptide repeat protein [Alphaproteobacteria bacterium]